MRYTQPQSGARIDWSNPITRNLAFALTPNNAIGAALVSNTSLRSVSGKMVANDYASSRQTQYRSSSPMTGAITLVVGVRVRTLSGYTALISKADTPDINQPFEFRIGSDNATNGRLSFGRATASGIKFFFGSTSGELVSAGSDILVAVRSTSGLVENTPTFFAGALGGALSSIDPSYIGGSATGNCTDNGGKIYVGRRADGVTQLDGLVYFSYGFDRALSEAEIRSLSDNPWQIFADSKKPIFIGVGAAPSGLSITAELATATASGQTATVNRQSNITATQAVASASGNTATVNRQLAVVATLATATASGQTATVNIQRSVAATQAAATATGYTANVQLGNDLSISATQAAATASGFDAAINRQLSIAATLATATASGFDASISNGASIAASYGLASADGYQAQVNLQREIAASLATASASGFTAAISTSTGTAVWPTPDQVLSGITYGPTGADYTGTATAGGYPTAADIAAAVRFDLTAELARIDAAISSRSTVAAIMGYDE